MKILLIQQKMIGDVLVSSLLCEHLKSHLQNSEVHYLIEEHTVAVVENNPSIDKIVFFRSEFKSSKTQFFSFLKSVRREKYDVVIDVYGKLGSNLITYFSKAPIRIAYSKWYSKFLYTHNIPILSRLPESSATTIDDRLALLDPLIKEKPDKAKSPKIYLTENELKTAENFLKANGISASEKLIMFGILGSGESKTYPLTYMAEIIDSVALQTQATLLFNYIPSQSKEAKLVYSFCKEETKKKICLEVFAPDLRQFLALLSQCECLIGNEGGSINMAKALQVPTFSVFSPWISKRGWNTYAGEKNIALHVSDYFPEDFKVMSKKEIKKNAQVLYKKFIPSLFEKDLVHFLKTKIFPDQ